jgi:dephospho-CoA kinase
VIDADELARQVVEPGGEVFGALVARFGPSVVGPGGALDRAALARRVFADPTELQALNAITHPAIEAAILVRLRVAAPGPAPVVVDLPLVTSDTRSRLGLAAVVVVDAPIEVAVGRLVEQRRFGEADARARVAAQMTREERRRLADVVIDNGGTREDLEARVDRLWPWLVGLGGSVDGPPDEAPDADVPEDHQEHQ